MSLETLRQKDRRVKTSLESSPRGNTEGVKLPGQPISQVSRQGAVLNDRSLLHFLVSMVRVWQVEVGTLYSGRWGCSYRSSTSLPGHRRW